jgi:hypothetical protein
VFSGCIRLFFVAKKNNNNIESSEKNSARKRVLFLVCGELGVAEFSFFSNTMRQFEHGKKRKATGRSREVKKRVEKRKTAARITRERVEKKNI